MEELPDMKRSRELHRHLPLGVAALLCVVSTFALPGEREGLAAGSSPAIQENEKQPDLRWVGCGITKKAFMAALAAAYQEKTGLVVGIEGGGATRGIRDVAAGLADLGGTCRHTIDVPEEANAVLYPVCWDALTVIAHPDNPVQDITMDQLRDVLSGKTTNWKDLGGADHAIDVYAREGKISGVGMMARELIFWDKEADWPGVTEEFKSSGPLEQALEANPYGFGLTGISSAKKSKLKPLSVNGSAPTVENIVAGKYPISRPMYLVAHKDASEKVTAFLDFARSEEGQAVIEKEGTVTLAQGEKLWERYRKLIKIAKEKEKARKK